MILFSGIMMDWAYSGVNKTVARNAGPECANYLNPIWRVVETVIVLTISIYLFIWSYKKSSYLLQHTLERTVVHEWYC